MKKLLALLIVPIVLLSCGRKSGAVGTYKDAPVIVISIDTLRADHLPMYGYTGVETPNLSAFRNDAVLFTNAFSHVPLTLPSHVSILTGLLPPQNGVRNNIGYTLQPGIPTIPTFLKGHGYDTGAAISAFVLRGTTGLAKQFDFYDDDITARSEQAAGSVQRSGRVTERIALQWIDGHASKPFFFLFHIFEPHSPYEPEEAFRDRYAAAPYDGEIATADAIVGSFLDELKRRGIYDRAVIVLLSDHGEGLDQHGEPEHGIFVYREDIHVPLMVKLPKNERGGTTVDRTAGLVDIFPTIAQLTGLTPPAKLSGVSLFAPPPASPRDIYSESLYARIHLGWSELRSLTDGRHHYIQAPRPELYDMQSDPGERKNVLADERRVYARMRDALQPYLDKAALSTKVDPEEAKKLAALGYLSSTSSAAAGELPDPKDRIGEIGDMVAAVRLMHDGRLDEAVAAFRKIIAANPRLSDAWTELGTALEKSGRYEEASAVYRTAIANTPELAGEFGLRRAAMLLHLEQYDEAERHARLAEKSNPGSAHLMLARIALSRKQFPVAASEAQAATADSTSRIPAEIVLARVFAQQDRVNEAQQALQRAAEDMQRQKSGPMESFEFTRGDILARMNRYDDAIAAFKREIELFPANRQAYANLYLVYLLLGRREEAAGTLEAMARAIPSRETMLFAAKTATTLGDSATAAEWKRRAAAKG